jgi:FkbM family methyltransferase
MKKIIKKFLQLFEPSLPVVSELKIEVDILGESGAQWAFAPSGLNSQSVVYSFGVGEDISWDTGMIEKYGVAVEAFDPTPKSIAWLGAQQIPAQFHFHSYGLAARDNPRELFYFPINPCNVSFSTFRKNAEPIELPVKRLVTIVQELGHTHIDILKIDIEGGEYEVLDDIVKSNLAVGQILVEFHHRWRGGVRNTQTAIHALQKAGYKIFYISPTKEEFSFIRL